MPSNFAAWFHTIWEYESVKTDARRAKTTNKGNGRSDRFMQTPLFNPIPPDFIQTKKMRKEFRGKRGRQGPDGYLVGFVEEDRRLVFSVFTHLEIFQEATVEA